MSTIPADAIVRINGSVLSAGGAQLAMNAVMLTLNDYLPMGAVVPFSSQSDVADYFGASSDEATLATDYFKGYTIAQSKPGRLYFSRCNFGIDVPAWLRGSAITDTIEQLAAKSGVLTITIDDETHTTGTITFSGLTSYSAMAAAIQTGLRAVFTADVICEYDSLFNAFIVTSATSGATSLITQATGSLADDVGLNAGTLSQGADELVLADLAGYMDGIVDVTQNWSSFMSVFEGTLNFKLNMSMWETSKNNRFMYVPWDTDAEAIVANSTTAFAVQAEDLGYTGVFAVYNDMNHAAFVCGVAASIDFTQTNNRPTFAFKQQDGLTPSVTSKTIADNLIANGYNFYGAYATAADEFKFLYPGQILGGYQWADSYVNQIWLNQGFQSDLMTLLVSIPSIPYNQQGYTIIATSLQTRITSAINYGAIRVGVQPTSTQAAVAQASAGLDISGALFNQGWYLQIKDPGPTARQARTTPVINFWYMDGQAVQQITVNSIMLQ